MALSTLPDISKEIYNAAAKQIDSNPKLSADDKKAAKKRVKESVKKGLEDGDKKFKDAEDRRAACKSCPNMEDMKDPCAELKKGDKSNNKRTFKGGSYGGTKKSGGKYESHHVPANSAYPPGTNMGDNKKTAMLMRKGDHANTASFASSGAAESYRNNQTKLIKAGNPEAAFGMDAGDIASIDKKGEYDEAVGEAAAYLACQKKYPGKYKFK